MIVKSFLKKILNYIANLIQKKYLFLKKNYTKTKVYNVIQSLN